ncbi:MAG TPA: CehA/McbA family metallohydrolase [Myxococcota bacterium]|nr:CehA/McbA family metallohydrolase [Myxococcota bacterium]
MRRALATRAIRLATLLAAAGALPDCGRAERAASDPPPAQPAAAAEAARPGPPTARWDVVDLMRDGAAAPRHPADGGGRARLVRDPDQPAYTTRATADRFRIVYEAGPLGVATGGSVQLQVSPFWGWSTPQVSDPDAPGFTEIHPSAPDIAVTAKTLDEQLLGIQVTGRPLVAGDRLEIVYGAGPARALTDRYAERDSRFWIAVDGDGDGVRAFLPDSPAIDVRAGPPAALLVTLPSVARPGEKVRVVLAVVDAALDTDVAFAGDAEFVDPPAGLALPRSVHFDGSEGGRRAVEAIAREPGTYRLEVKAGELRAQSNPLIVSAEGPRVLWGDLHGHSAFSDGTGLPEDYFTYARDVSALDVVALTDHDHWGILPLAEHPELWREIRVQTRRFHAPGRFVTLLGFEWTSWIYGHRHVLYFTDDGPVIDSVAEGTDTPAELWQALGDRPAITVPHHPAGGPIAIDWDIAPDPRFEPVAEIVSIHGSSEAPDSPALIHEPVAGHFARDALARGYRLGFIGSGDRHDGHPGAFSADTHASAEGGLGAILSEERTREGVLRALRERRVYATNGARIVLRVALGGTPIGGVVPIATGERRHETLFVSAVGTAPLERLEVVRSGAVVDGVALDGRLEATMASELADLAAGEYVYVRVAQRDGGAAWSSPIFVGEQPAR